MQEQDRLNIRGLLERHMPDYDLKDDEDIFATGFVNSLFMMQLVLFLEKTFDVVFENEDLDTDNFRSVNAILALLERKQIARSAA
jgi:acyl carrier protein